MGLLRLIFASLVVVSHAFPLGGWGTDPSRAMWRDQTDISQLGLLGFFALSGYLITQSAERRDPLQFLWARVVRIFPAYLVVLAIGAVVIGPWFYARENGTFGGYWSAESGGPLTYVLHNGWLAQNQRGIHEIWSWTPYGVVTEASVINGSLWTLPWEFVCYAFIGGLALIGLLRRARWVVPACAMVLLISFVVNDLFPGMIWNPTRARILSVLCIFLIGATFRLYGTRIPIRPLLGAGAAAIIVGTLWLGGFSSLGVVAYAYLVLWLAVSLPQRCHGVGARYDLSYACYLLGWPTAMALTSYAVPALGYPIYVALTFAIILPLAWLSFVVVERPALRLKNWGPGMGIARIKDTLRQRVPVN